MSIEIAITIVKFTPCQKSLSPTCSATAICYKGNEVYSAADEGKPTLLISLDLSAAFGIVDHVTYAPQL